MLPNYDQLQKLLDALNITPYRIGKETSVKAQTLSSWKNGEYFPKRDKIEVLAKYFNVPAAYFYEGGTSARVLADYPQEYWEQKEAVFDVAAGQGRINGEYAGDTIDDAPPDEEYSFARIHGDSMLPVLQDGDIVKVHHQSETDPSDFTVVKVDGESATVKHVEIVENGVWLRAENKEVYEDTFFSIQEVMTLPVTIIGKAVEIRRAL